MVVVRATHTTYLSVTRLNVRFMIVQVHTLNFGVCVTISDDDNDAMILVKVMKLQAGFN